MITPRLGSIAIRITVLIIKAALGTAAKVTMKVVKDCERRSSQCPYTFTKVRLIDRSAKQKCILESIIADSGLA